MNQISLPEIGLTKKQLSEFEVIKTKLLLNLANNKVVTILPTAQNRIIQTITNQIAETLARGQRRVLLIHTDITSDTAQNMMEDHKGLYDILSDKAFLDDCICSTDVDGFCILQAGEKPEFASELLGGVTFTKIIDYLKQQFDVILILFPAINDSLDGITASNIADGCIVITFTNTSFGRIKKELTMLQKGTTIIGSILVKNCSSRRTPLFNRKGK